VNYSFDLLLHPDVGIIDPVGGWECFQSSNKYESSEQDDACDNFLENMSHFLALSSIEGFKVCP
jgi:hypothetical protein